MKMHRVALAVLAFALVPASAGAVTEVWVTTALDFGDPDLTDGICGYERAPRPDGTLRAPICSLRAAIQEANHHAPTQYAIEILFPGHHLLFMNGAGEDHAATGDLDIWGNVIIRGTGATPSACPFVRRAEESPYDVTGCRLSARVSNATTISGRGDRIFDVHPGGRLLLSHVALTHGRVHSPRTGAHPPLAGGAIRNAGLLTIANVGFLSNSADTGGALYNSETGSADVVFTTMSRNRAESLHHGGCGGAILNEGLMRFTNVVLFSNDTDGNGGALCNHSAHTRGFPITDEEGYRYSRSLEMHRFAVVNNGSWGSGGGIASTSSMLLMRGTIRGNDAVNGAGVMMDAFDPEDRVTTLDLVDIGQNFADREAGGTGGGLWVRGPLWMREAKIDRNETLRGGAGMWVEGDGEVLVWLSEFSGNETRNVSGTGGAVGGVLSGSGHVWLSNTTISGNTAALGGGVGVTGPKGTTVTIRFVTLAKNQAWVRGSNVWTDGLMLTSIHGSLLTLGTAGRGREIGLGLGCVFSALLSSSARNFTDDASCVRGFIELDVTPLIDEELRNNGGSTNTHALAPGSAARDVVGLADCGPDEPYQPPMDQRWITRPQGSACDAGAYEYEGLSLLEMARHVPPLIGLRSSAGRVSGAAVALQLVLESIQQPSKEVDAVVLHAQQLAMHADEAWAMPDEQALAAKLTEVRASFASLETAMKSIHACCQSLPDQRYVYLLEYAVSEFPKALDAQEQKPPTPVEK
jgi:hypothetical protein